MHDNQYRGLKIFDAIYGDVFFLAFTCLVFGDMYDVYCVFNRRNTAINGGAIMNAGTINFTSAESLTMQDNVGSESVRK